MKGKYLITTDNWFTAPNGIEYKSIWGEVAILEDNILGVKTNRDSVNWYAKIGSEENHVIVAGCQVNYAVRCEKKPYTDEVQTWNTKNDGKVTKDNRPTFIYIAE